MELIIASEENWQNRGRRRRRPPRRRSGFGEWKWQEEIIRKQKSWQTHWNY